jgi:hypothetical protein
MLHGWQLHGRVMTDRCSQQQQAQHIMIALQLHHNRLVSSAGAGVVLWASFEAALAGT